MSTDTQNDGMIRAKAMRFSRDPRAVSIVNRILIAMAVHETIQPIVDRFKQQILDERCYTDDEGNRVEDISLDWTIDQAGEQFNDYFERLNGILKQDGWKAAGQGKCPALTAESQKIKAEIELIQLAQDITGAPFTEWQTLEQRAGILQTLIGLVTNAPGYRAPSRREKLQAIEDVKNIC